MVAKELSGILKNKNQTIYIKIENGLYYPIKDIRKEGNNIILVCPDLMHCQKHNN